jgi:hypothetical protein
MTITFRTVALDVPPTPLGLLRGRVVIEHWCNLCRLRVATEDLAHMPAPTAPPSLRR